MQNNFFTFYSLHDPSITSYVVSTAEKNVFPTALSGSDVVFQSVETNSNNVPQLCSYIPWKRGPLDSTLCSPALESFVFESYSQVCVSPCSYYFLVYSSFEGKIHWTIMKAIVIVLLRSIDIIQKRI